MATVRRFESANQLDILTATKSVFEKSKEATDHLVVALFNIEFPERGTIEGRLKEWQNHYKNTCGAKFYKYIITKGKQKIKIDFEIKDTPTLIFFRNGIQIERIDDLEEVTLGISTVAKGSGESNDEKRVKERLDKLCKKNEPVTVR